MWSWRYAYKPLQVRDCDRVIPSDSQGCLIPITLLVLGSRASLEAMRVEIRGLSKYQGRNPNGYFQDLDWNVRQRAHQWLHRFCERAHRQRGYVPQWLFAIYVGQAKRLALNPPTSEWGRRMLAQRGGRAVQRKYRLEGRNPTEAATWARLADLKLRKDAEHRKRLGLPPKARHGFTV
jgi:hypothetical protein